MKSGGERSSAKRIGSILPDALLGRSRPMYVHPSVKCPRCQSGWMHVEYDYDERVMVCDVDECGYFDYVVKVGHYGLQCNGQCSE